MFTISVLLCCGFSLLGGRCAIRVVHFFEVYIFNNQFNFQHQLSLGRVESQQFVPKPKSSEDQRPVQELTQARASGICSLRSKMDS